MPLSCKIQRFSVRERVNVLLFFFSLNFLKLHNVEKWFGFKIKKVLCFEKYPRQTQRLLATRAVWADANSLWLIHLNSMLLCPHRFYLFILTLINHVIRIRSQALPQTWLCGGAFVRWIYDNLWSLVRFILSDCCGNGSKWSSDWLWVISLQVL